MAQNANDINHPSGSQRVRDVTQGKQINPKMKVGSAGVGEGPGGTRLSSLHRKWGWMGWVRDLVAPAFLFYILRQMARMLRILRESRTHRWPRILMILVMLAEANEPGPLRQ